MERYSYPGNIRELENIVHRAAILCKTKLIEPEILPSDLRDKITDNSSNFNPHDLSFKDAKEKVVTDFERNFIKQVLKECNGVISQAAEKMGMHKKNLHEKINKYGIYPDRN